MTSGVIGDIYSGMTKKRLDEAFFIDPEKGNFLWKINPRGQKKAGKLAGAYGAKGYIYITIDGRKYRAHRLIWFYVHGEWPKTDLDHINGKKDDNRICNLRIATRAENNANSKINRRNSSGYRGVSWNKDCERWQTHIRHSGRSLYLGMFDSKEDASAEYIKVAKKLKGEFVREA